jgi:hypothetical protein
MTFLFNLLKISVFTQAEGFGNELKELILYHNPAIAGLCKVSNKIYPPFNRL